MARTPGRSGGQPRTPGSGSDLTSGVDEMLLAALERGDDGHRTGRYLITYKEGATTEGIESMRSLGMRAADARDFSDQAVTVADVGDADALVLPEIGVALVSGAAFAERAATLESVASDSPFEIVEPEYFVFADGASADYLRGFRRAADVIATDLAGFADTAPDEIEFTPEALGATWGLTACRVPQSTRSGAGVKVAVLDTGLDLGHPDFAGRAIVAQTFVGQPVQDLHSHGTHCAGTACGTRTPPGTTPRYGIAWQAPIFIGKVLSNAGKGVGGSVLAGMNWAIANKCAVISMSLGAPGGVQAAYTAAGQSALNNGCLIIAAAGNDAANTGSPANSPTIVSVASLDQNLTPSSFSNFGKIEIAGPGRDVFSSVPRPTRYGIKSGTSMATPHVAGCAALLAQATGLRGAALRARLLGTARALPFPASRVGRGLVQAPA